MPDRCDADVFEILGGKLAQHRPIDLIVAESGLVSLEPQAAQPFCDIHQPVSRSADYRPQPAGAHAH